MTHHWTALVKLSVPFLALFAVAEWLYRNQQVQPEHTRKLVHAGTGLLTLLFPIWLTTWWQAAALCGAFLIVLVISKKWGFLESIHGVARKTVGSGLYPVIVALAFAFYLYVAKEFTLFQPHYYFYMPVLIMALADPAAALAGKWYQKKYRFQSGKTVIGSVAFFGVAFVISGLLMSIFATDDLSISTLLLAVSLAFFTMLAEKYSRNGWDNFFIPLTAMGVQWLFESGYR